MHAETPRGGYPAASKDLAEGGVQIAAPAATPSAPARSLCV